MDSVLHSTLEKSWRATCRILFGQELGALDDYGEWLAEYLLKTARRKSHVSGNEVIIARDEYPQSARFVSADEVAQNRDYALGINQIKDVESIVEALQEKCEYTGNRVLGTSAFVESSDIVMDSQYVYNSTNIEQSSHVYSSYMMRRGSKHVFGSGYTANGEFLLRVTTGINLRRCFESHFVSDSSDLYFCFNCDGCHDALFSFGQRNKDRTIGNLALPKDKYARLKAKLLGEVAEQLVKNRRFESLFRLVPDRAPGKLPAISLQPQAEETSMEMAEKAFSSAFGVVLKRQPPSMTQLEGWLSSNTLKLEEVKTPFGETTCIPLNFGIVSAMPRGRMTTIPELVELGKIAMNEKSLGSLGKILDSLGSIAFFSADYSQGENRNIIKGAVILHSTNVYKGYESTYSENTGLTSISLHSKYVYGCHRIIDSQFCLKCYNSLYLNRCFELDSCNSCADSYFCHNCEAMQDAMFCFNMKGRRHQIGNTQFDKDTYSKAKASLVSQMAMELEKKKTLKWSIYSLGAGK